MGVAVLASLLASPAQAETVTISMKDRVFIPEKITVKMGDTVFWENNDTELHNVISGATPYDPDLGHPMMSGIIMWKARYAFTFTKPGSYRYLCFIHSSMEGQTGVKGMVGEVIVTDGAESPR